MEHALQIAAVIGVIGLLWLTLNSLRRLRANGSNGPRLQIQQRISIANGCQLVLVQWDGQELLLATGAQNCTVVSRKPIARSEAITESRSAWAR
jgi:flagellar biogenesis protein FliO